MSWNQLEGEWRRFTGAVREQWGLLTDDDVEHIAGKRDQLVGRLQEHYGLSTEAAEGQVDDWIAKMEQVRAENPP